MLIQALNSCQSKKDSEGFVPRTTIIEALNEHGTNLEPSLLDAMVDRFGVATRGDDIDIGNFLSVIMGLVQNMAESTPQPVEENPFAAMFHGLDTDHDGKLSKEDLIPLVQNMAPGQPVDDNTVAQIFSIMDKQGKGYITVEDFALGIQEFSAQSQPQDILGTSPMVSFGTGDKPTNTPPSSGKVRFDNDLQRYKTKNTQLQQQVDMMKAQLTHAESSQGSIISQLESSNREKETLQRQVKDFQADLAQTRTIASELEQAKVDLNAQKDALRESKLKEQELIQSRDTALGELSEKRKELNDVVDELNLLKNSTNPNEANALKQAIEQYKARIMALEGERSNLETKLKELEDANQQLQQAAEAVNQKLEDARKQISILEEEKLMASPMKKSAQSGTDLMAELSKSMIQPEKIDLKIQESAQALSPPMSPSSSEMSLSQLQRLADLEAELESLKQQLAASLNDKAQLTTSLQESVERIKLLNQEKSNLVQQLESMTKELNALRASEKDKTLQLQLLQGQKEALEKQLADLQQLSMSPPLPSGSNFNTVPLDDFDPEELEQLRAEKDRLDRKLAELQRQKEKDDELIRQLRSRKPIGEPVDDDRQRLVSGHGRRRPDPEDEGCCSSCTVM